MKVNTDDYCSGCFWAGVCSSADKENAMFEGCDHMDVDTMSADEDELVQWRDDIAEFQGEWQQYVDGCHDSLQEYN